MTAPPTGFREALHAQGPAPDRADKLGLYAFLVGSWEFDAIYTNPADGTTRQTAGEIHAGWVLDGRAIMDTWIVPARRLPRPASPQFGDFHGSTLRAYDASIDAWRIRWSDPWRHTYTEQVGRARGRDIVQEGTDAAGGQHRWSFTEVTPDSFRWIGEASPDGGTTWVLYADFRARRIAD